jgi:transposase
MWGSSRTRVFVYSEPCDMRLGFQGLCGLVRSVIKQDPLSGHYFFFLNRRRTYAKILWWDGTGYCLMAKQLSQGTFTSPEVSREWLLTELLAVLEYPSTTTKTRRYRYVPQESEASLPS